MAPVPEEGAELVVSGAAGFPAPPLVADVSTGAGAFSLHAAERGFQVAAIESDPAYSDLLLGSSLLRPATGGRIWVTRRGVRPVKGRRCEAYWRELQSELLESSPPSPLSGRNARADLKGPG